MKLDIIKLLTECSPKHRTRLLKKNDELMLWISKNYPNVPLNIVADALVKGYSPFCSVCGKPIKHLNKQTCSTSCRSKSTATKMSDIVEKRKKTNIEKYGNASATGAELVKQKRIATMIKKYGAKVSPKTAEAARSRSDNLNAKGRKTLQEKYGITNPGQLADHRVKCVETLKKNYGVDNYYKSQEFKELSVEKNFKKWQFMLPACVELIDITDNESKKSLFDNPNKEIKFKCNQCNTIDAIPSETVKWRIRNTGTPCIKCSGINVGSLKQREVQDFITSLGVHAVSNFKLPSNQEIDIYCPDYFLGVEFDGLFWHNDLRVPKSYHLDKTLECRNQNIKLIHIFEDEWDFKRDIVKSRIKNLLGVTGTKIFARNCKVLQLSKQEEKQFMEQNHIQGFANSSIAYGLYHNGTLVSAMSFSKPNKAKGQQSVLGHWELLRFCNLLDTTVVGGAGKLIKHFITIYHPKQLLSFADTRWSTGELYKKLGFTSLGNTAINYWYIKHNRRHHRYGLRKNRYDDQSLTEYENRLNQGFLRIWDCGNTKWILHC